MNKNEKVATGICFSSAAITAITTIASNGGFIPESVCFIAMVATLLAGMGIVGKIIITASKASGGN